MQMSRLDQQPATRTLIPNWALVLLIALIALAGAYRLVKRAFPDAITLAADIRSTYLSAHAWAVGHNPYAADEQQTQWSQFRPAGEDDLPPHYWTTELPLYPPGLYALLSPLTLLPWKLVRMLVLLTNLGLSVAAYLSLMHVLRLPLSGWRAQLFGALWLFIGPFITSVKLANTVLPAVMLCVLAVCLAIVQYDLAAGVVLGLATLLKPQLGGALLLCYMLRGRPRIWIATLALVCLIQVVGVGRLAIAHVHWMPTLKENIAILGGPGGFDDANLANLSRWQLINLQVPLFALLSNRMVVNALAWAIVIALGIAYLVILRRSDSPRNEMLVASVPLVLCLLPVYHRYYDALILLIPLAWAIRSLGTVRQGHAILVLLCTLPFYLSGAYVLWLMETSHRIPPSIATNKIWTVFISPHQTWVLVFLSLVLMHALWVSSDERNPEAASR